MSPERRERLANIQAEFEQILISPARLFLPYLLKMIENARRVDAAGADALENRSEAPRA